MIWCITRVTWTGKIANSKLKLILLHENKTLQQNRQFQFVIHASNSLKLRHHRLIVCCRVVVMFMQCKSKVGKFILSSLNIGKQALTIQRKQALTTYRTNNKREEKQLEKKEKDVFLRISFDSFQTLRGALEKRKLFSILPSALRSVSDRNENPTMKRKNWIFLILVNKSFSCNRKIMPGVETPKSWTLFVSWRNLICVRAGAHWCVSDVEKRDGN